MDDQERQLLERAQEQIRASVKLLPDRKDDRITLIREFVGAEEEGAAYDVLLIVGEAQKAGPDFWEAVTTAGSLLGAQANSPWLSTDGQEIFARQCSN